ncbi:MAG: MBL fold metallo-hydrolase [Candidatus Bathyarchaeia archaeon]
MKARFLGTGVIVPTIRRGFPGLLVEVGEELLLFDCGAGTVTRLTRLGHDVSGLKHVFLTHFHIDHVSDYLTLVKSRAFMGGGTLRVYGPEGLVEGSKRLFVEHPWFRYVSETLRCFEYLELREVFEGVVARTDDWSVSCAPTAHYRGVAYRVDNGRGSLLYSGDTTLCDSLVRLGMNVDVAVLECSYSSRKSLRGHHLYPESAAELAQRMKAKRLILTHLYPETEGKEQYMIDEIKQRFDGVVNIAEDLMEIEV